ncbi:MAG: hypothetical protein V4487_05040 [Chlamydiota bacterium]
MPMIYTDSHAPHQAMHCSQTITSGELKDHSSNPFAKEHFEVSFAASNIQSSGDVKIETGPGVMFNHMYPWNWVMHASGRSYITFTTNLTEEEAAKDLEFNIRQLSSIVRGQGHSPIAIEVNGQIIADRVLPQVDGWRNDRFSLKGRLVAGENKFTIRLLSDAWSNYWIEKASITLPNANLWE